MSSNLHAEVCIQKEISHRVKSCNPQHLENSKTRMFSFTCRMGNVTDLKPFLFVAFKSQYEWEGGHIVISPISIVLFIELIEYRKQPDFILKIFIKFSRINVVVYLIVYYYFCVAISSEWKYFLLGARNLI